MAYALVPYFWMAIVIFLAIVFFVIDFVVTMARSHRNENNGIAILVKSLKDTGIFVLIINLLPIFIIVLEKIVYKVICKQ